MGYRYYADVRFPMAATKIEEIKTYLDDTSNEFEENEDCTITVSDDSANQGAIDITELLVKHKVPYDHYHRDDNDCTTWTEKYRLDTDNNLTMAVSESGSEEAISDFAKTVLSALESGKTEDAYGLLNGVIYADVQSIDDIVQALQKNSNTFEILTVYGNGSMENVNLDGQDKPILFDSLAAALADLEEFFFNTKEAFRKGDLSEDYKPEDYRIKAPDQIYSVGWAKGKRLSLVSSTVIFEIPADEDQPTTCPICGSRTDFHEFNSGKQRHICLNETCGKIFFTAPEK